MIKRVVIVLLVGLISMTYVVSCWLYIECYQQKKKWWQQRSQLQQAVQLLQQRRRLQALWLSNQQQLSCLNSKQTVEQVMSNWVSVISHYDGQLQQIDYKDNAADLSVVMPVNKYFQWLFSQTMKKLCLLPTQIHIKQTSGLSQIKMHVVRVSYD
jgi:hypothetical protein